MSFDTMVVLPDRGRVLRVDVSTDEFATITYRWGDKAGLLDGTNQYENRVLELGAVRRALGENRIAASSTSSLTLDNADGAFDALCGSTGLALAASLRFRVYVCIYDPTVSPVSLQSKMLGEFVIPTGSFPVQTRERVSFALADDMMGRLGPGLQLPNFLDWQAVGTTANNPIKSNIGIPDSMSPYTPIQLAFGEDWLLTHPHVIPWDNNASGDTYADKIIVPLYCTTDLSAVSQALIQNVRVERYHKPATPEEPNNIPELYDIPRTVADFAQGTTTPATLTVWTVEKSPTITKAGKDYQIVYLVVRTDLGDRSLYYAVQDQQHASAGTQYWNYLSAFAYQGGYPTEAVDSDLAGDTGPGGGGGGSYAPITSRVMRWYVLGVPHSQRTNPPTLIPGSHAIDVMTDLVSVYSDATVDTTSAARVKAGSPFTRCFGVVQAWSERANNAALYQPPLSLRQVLTQLAQSSDFDIFMNWAGQVAFASDVLDFTTATQPNTLLEVMETEVKGFKRWVPSNGERHSTYNRVYLEGGRANPAAGYGYGLGGYGNSGISFQGPWDLAEATIPVSTRIIEMGLQQGWRPWLQQQQDPIRWRSIDVVSRDRVSFGLGLQGLLHELGQYFKLTWTRGASIGGPYSSTIFQCEAITYQPDDDTVQIEAVWRDESQTERQYLLDDETLLVRTKNVGDSALGVLDTSSTVSIATGTDSFVTMGVTAGDILVLRDTTEAADLFTRNRCIRITARTSATAITVDPTDLDFDAPAGAGVAAADWSIVRGATTYPTAVSDPTNYPSGGTMYGKATAANGTTSDAATGNRLISG